MNIPVTLITVFLVYGFVKYANELVPNGLASKLKIPLALVVGIGVAFLMRETDFAVKQQFFDQTLDTMSSGTIAVVGLMLGFGAVGVDTTFKTVRNIGSNDVPAP